MTWPPTHRRAVVSKRIGRTFAVLLCCCTASVGSVPLAPAHRGILSPASADAAERHIISAATLRFRRENAVQVWGWGSTAVVPNRDTQRFTVMNAVATYPKEEMIYSNSRRIAPCIDASSTHRTRAPRPTSSLKGLCCARRHRRKHEPKVQRILLHPVPPRLVVPRLGARDDAPIVRLAAFSRLIFLFTFSAAISSDGDGQQAQDVHHQDGY